MGRWTEVSLESYTRQKAGETAGDRPAREIGFDPKTTGT